MNKKSLCDGIAVATDWSKAVKLSNSEIKSMAIWLQAQIPDRFIAATSTMLENCTVNKRSRACFNGAMKNIPMKQYGDAIHEIHDFIFEYGQNLDEEMSDSKWIMLNELVNRLLDSINE